MLRVKRRSIAVCIRCAPQVFFKTRSRPCIAFLGGKCNFPGNLLAFQSAQNSSNLVRKVIALHGRASCQAIHWTSHLEMSHCRQFFSSYSSPSQRPWTYVQFSFTCLRLYRCQETSGRQYAEKALWSTMTSQRSPRDTFGIHLISLLALVVRWRSSSEY